MIENLDLFACPPFDYLFYVAKNCPLAIYTYLCLWRNQDRDGRLFRTRDQIRDEDSESWTCFVNNLRRLQKHDLLEFNFANDKDAVVIILAAYIPETDKVYNVFGH
jgi:hypothetical protein